MGRLAGIKHFLSQDAWAEEKADSADLRRAKKDAADEQVNDSLKRLQVEISLRHQSRFEGRLVRRTVDSKDWEGKVLIDLPPAITIGTSQPH